MRMKLAASASDVPGRGSCTLSFLSGSPGKILDLIPVCQRGILEIFRPRDIIYAIARAAPEMAENGPILSIFNGVFFYTYLLPSTTILGQHKAYKGTMLAPRTRTRQQVYHYALRCCTASL